MSIHRTLATVHWAHSFAVPSPIFLLPLSLCSLVFTLSTNIPPHSKSHFFRSPPQVRREGMHVLGKKRAGYKTTAKRKSNQSPSRYLSHMGRWIPTGIGWNRLQKVWAAKKETSTKEMIRGLMDSAHQTIVK